MSATIPASKGGFDEQIKKKTVMTFFLLFYSVRTKKTGVNSGAGEGSVFFSCMGIWENCNTDLLKTIKLFKLGISNRLKPVVNNKFIFLNLLSFN
jgi:hypothetical protein